MPARLNTSTACYINQKTEVDIKPSLGEYYIPRDALALNSLRFGGPTANADAPLVKYQGRIDDR